MFAAVYLAADDGSSWAAGIIFGVAGVTDQVDGFLARRWHVESRFGTLADPLADRLMIDTAVILLWLEDKLPWYGALVILAAGMFCSWAGTSCSCRTDTSSRSASSASSRPGCSTSRSAS